MPRTFVRIVNRETYTTVDKARTYVDRRLAEVVLLSLSRQILAIRMLEAAELVLLKSHMNHARREENVDDGTERRWVKRESGSHGNGEWAQNGALIRSREPREKDPCGYGVIVVSPARIPVQQLLPVKFVGTNKRTSKTRDMLIRPQARHDPGKSVTR